MPGRDEAYRLNKKGRAENDSEAKAENVYPLPVGLPKHYLTNGGLHPSSIRHLATRMPHPFLVSGLRFPIIVVVED